jgi:antitoxin component YwqK of YwqJK toxin-antitoxin module
MKHLLSLSFTFVLSLICTAQSSVETATINGKSYFVYPYQQEVEFSGYLFRMGVKEEEILHRDSLNRKVLSTEVIPCKRIIPFPPEYQKNKKLLVQLRTEYPGMLMDETIPLNVDITPTLEELPDGEYVQYYRDFPYVDKANILRYRNDIVAAFFHLKDNKLDGYAYWLNSLGDTIKAGSFNAGLKEGPWQLNKYTFKSLEQYKSKEKVLLEKFLNGTYKYKEFYYCTYKDGLLNGPTSNGSGKFVRERGFYTNDEQSGEWFKYGRKRTEVEGKTIYSDEPIILTHYFIPTKETIAKNVIIRNRILDRNLYAWNKDYIVSNGFSTFSEYYNLYAPEEQKDEDEGLELEEEKTSSYPGAEDEYEDYMRYEEEYYEESVDFRYDNPNRTYYLKGKEYSRNDLIDSLGYIAQYDKVYEEYYYNGQLKLRFEIIDGKIIEPDTMYWDNGNPISILTFDPNNQTYKEQVFDYNHILLYTLDYDAKGNVTSQLYQEEMPVENLIHGKPYYFNKFLGFYELRSEEWGLTGAETDSITLFESLWSFDTTVAVLNTFDPKTRTLDNKSYALNKDLVYHLNCEFGEEYDNFVGTEVCQSGKLMTKTVLNGSYTPRFNPYFYEMGMEDTLPMRRAFDWKYRYETTSDFTLFYDNNPFSGKFTMTANAPNFNLVASRDAIHLDYSTSEKHRKALLKAYNVYKKRGKVLKEAGFMTMPTFYEREISSLVFNVLPFSNELFKPVSDYFFRDLSIIDYEHLDKKGKILPEKEARAFDKAISGQFMNGKPSGLWITSDQFGNPTTKMEFENGDLNGVVEHYKTAVPRKKRQFEFDYEQIEYPWLMDRFPEEPTHYLAKQEHYKNGLLDGPAYELTWYGDTVSRLNYKEGRPHGEALYNFKLGYTLAHFEDGLPDGIARAYLTIPGRDTTLLFDLNYQNGQLQGESKTYHLNGRLAKHAFFLSGQPIDDFEAFDTLGFKYQYVKFQYSQPIEEKIWEENQLSVRYEFDWHDSIPFDSQTLTETSSLERLMFQMGLNGYQQGRPYYGRPSTVDKTGIKYTMTKYYPNDTIARQGKIDAGKKIGHWTFFNYEGRKLYEVNYFDSIMAINDSVRFKSKGILTLLDTNGRAICKSYIVEKIEKYDCAHTDHHEMRMLYTFWERDTNQHRINGYVKNYYDNGVLMNEGMMKNGLATGTWQFYDPYGSLSMVGDYVIGKRNGRWLSGDLSQVKYMGDICLNPNLPNLEEILGYQEKLLDISVIYYQMTVVKKREYYGVNMNAEGPPEGFDPEEIYYDEE